MGEISFVMLAERLVSAEGDLPLRSAFISDSKTTAIPTAGVMDREVGLGLCWLKVDPRADLVPFVMHLREPCGFCSTAFQRKSLKNPNLPFYFCQWCVGKWQTNDFSKEKKSPNS